MILPDYMIRELRGNDQVHAFEPWSERTVSDSGMSFGLSSAGYDIRSKQEITLEPGKFALLSSLERFSLPDNVLGIMHDKSTWARRGLAVQNTVAEPGWSGFLTIEVTNHGEEPLTIKAGDPILQVVLHRLAGVPKNAYRGKYQNQPDRPVEALREDGSTYAAPAPLTLSAAQAERDERQVKVGRWVEGLWGRAALHAHERVERLVEEVFELAQAEGVKGGVLGPSVVVLVSRLRTYQLDPTTNAAIREVEKALKADRLSMIADRVYQKSPGALAQEVGGIGTCLLAYCEGRGLSADFCERAELERILALPDDHFRQRHAAKIQSGLALKLIDGPAA